MYSPIPLLKKRSVWGDALALATLAITIYAMMFVARQWSGELRSTAPIDLGIHNLPLYSLYSLFRALAAYGISFIFSIVVGYAAAKTEIGERFILPLLDIGQSIPVLGFMPGLVLGLVGIFPNSNFGLELACVLLIFTGQVWNMTFSFYSSLKSIPVNFLEVSQIVGLSRWKRLLRIELPASATGLAWNSLVSMAGGWFFLTVCESFSLGKNDFRLPGLGSYMSLAIERGHTPAIISGIVAMVIVIVVVDFFLWRPIIAWTRKFQMDDQGDVTQEIPFVTLLLRESTVVQRILNFLKTIHFRRAPEIAAKAKKRKKNKIEEALLPFNIFAILTPNQRRTLNTKLLNLLVVLFLLWVLTRVWELIRPLTFADYEIIFQGTFYTTLRVFAAIVIASIWAVPAGILIGLSPRMTRFLQPIIQVAASFPAPMIYPLVIAATQYFGMNLGFGSVILMLLGVQWYILFNVLAGSIGISRELRDHLKLVGVSRIARWKHLYLPSVFPALVTGWVTAAGGAWNASIIAEYIQYKGDLLRTNGLGALISEATATGNYHFLAGCLLMMVTVVVGLNRSLWKALFQIAQTKYRFER
ncbi:MAG: ABC transporter permease subunit [Deltaproteobacteria bacterium]|nr:ABC transporter permease subunit [Deltaproteobacteria bacterium]